MHSKWESYHWFSVTVSIKSYIYLQCVTTPQISVVVMRIKREIGIFVILSAIHVEFQTTPSIKNIDNEDYFIVAFELLQSVKELESYGWLCLASLLILAAIVRISHVIGILVIFLLFHLNFQQYPFESQIVPSFKNIYVHVYIIKQLELLQSEQEQESYGWFCIPTLLISATPTRIDHATEILVIFTSIRFQFQPPTFLTNIHTEVYCKIPHELLQPEHERESYRWFYVVALLISTATMRIDHVIRILVICSTIYFKFKWHHTLKTQILRFIL